MIRASLQVRLLTLLLLPIAACGLGGDLQDSSDSTESDWEKATGNCIACHEGIETAHTGFPLGCAHCHGGNPEAKKKEEAHVQPKAPLPQDATVLPQDYFDKEYLRFVNPTNLRVVPTTCGQSGEGMGTTCHAKYAADLEKSMMATTTGHLTGGAYQNGILPDLTAIWSNFPVVDTDGDVPSEDGALESLVQIPASLPEFDESTFEHHYGDVPRKICARCHLWSRGKAVRGVPGQEGNYRSEGCAACHMPYTNAALSESADPTRDHGEVGHPRVHRLTTKIPTEQCGHCHTRGARIGLSYQGLAQLPPGTATGEDYAGLTPEKIYGAYHVQNPAVNPPDIHYELGMACIDCHVREESMGDGNIYGHMDQATQIECEDCHGTPTAYGPMVTGKGTPHDHLRWDNGVMILTGKLDGVEHIVPQVKDIVDPTHSSYNEDAAAAMTSDHLKSNGGLECYTCHSAWQNNCYGCHFNRDLGEDALDMFAGEPTHGKPSTGNKYFLNFKNFHMGYNAEGKVAPFVTGCQTLATVVDEHGGLVLEQELPVTSKGRSGLSLNPVQPHTVRAQPRTCQECHRNAAAVGLGTESFALSRRYLVALQSAPDGALVVIDREDESAQTIVARLPLDDPRELVLATDPIDGNMRVAHVVDASLGLVTVDVSDPTTPVITSSMAADDAHSVAVAGTTLYMGTPEEGVIICTLVDPLHPEEAAIFPVREALGLTVHGFHLFVADGADGLVILDVEDPTAPSMVATLDLNGADAAPNQAVDIAVMPHYRNPPEDGGPKPFEMVAYVADGSAGVRVVDIVDPSAPEVIATYATTDARAVRAKFHYDTGDKDTPSIEHEYLLIADGAGGLRVADITDPAQPRPVTSLALGADVTDIAVANAFEPPLNKLYVFAATGGTSITTIDWSDMTAPVTVGTLAVGTSRGIDVERVRLDRLVDEDGVMIKDTSHEGARTFTREELARILGADY